MQRLSRLCLNKHSGFTLVELMISLAVVAIIAALIVSPGYFWGQILTHAEVEKVRTVCHYLRGRAVAQGVEQSLTFDPLSHSYHYDGMERPLPKQIRFGLVDGVMGPPTHPTSPIKHAVTFADNRLICYPDGSMSSGAVYFVDRDRHHQYAITTGVGRSMRVHVYHYTGSWRRIA